MRADKISSSERPNPGSSLAAAKSLISNGGSPHDVVDANEGLTIMHAAANEGHLDALEYLIQQGGDVNIRIEAGGGFIGGTPLHYALSGDLAKLLIDRGALIDAPGPLDNTPLAAAARRARLSTVISLVTHGASINARDSRFGMTTLMWACVGLAYENSDNPAENRLDDRMKIIDFLASKGVDVNATDNEGETALHMAAKYDPQCVKLLLKLGANPDAKDNSGKQPIDWSRELGQSESVVILETASKK